MQKQQKKPIRNAEKCRFYGPVATIFNGVKTGSWRLEKPRVNYSECIRCGNCERFCPVNVIDIDQDQGYVKINYDYCKGCGICANECPAKCIDIVPERGDIE